MDGIRRLEQLLHETCKRVEEKDVLVTSLRQEAEELRCIAEKAQMKQAEAESSLKDNADHEGKRYCCRC